MKVLVFAPHNDDEVLGCGGTIAKYVAEGNEVVVCEITYMDTDYWYDIQKEALKAHELLGVSETIFMKLPVVGLKHVDTKEINRKFQEVVDSVKPNVVFIPHRGDMHIDHKETSLAAMVALRPLNNPQLRAIYAYETLSETEWDIPSVENVFVPDTWFDISDYFDRKVNAMECFKTQLCEMPHPRSIEAIEALATYRGCSVGVKKAECFKTIRKVVL